MATPTPPVASQPPVWQTKHILRVCADPNNLPFSNSRGEGFENKLAQMIARDLGANITYTWWPQRRGFIRNTLKADRCDVVMGVPAHYDMVQPTSPYYTSTYVFVTRKSRHLHITSLNDTPLRHLTIGLHTIGDDYANPPAAEAFARRGIIQNIVGYSIYGDYSKPNPPADLIKAVANNDVDVAVVWGPLAGYFAKQSPEPLQITPVTPRIDPLSMPFVYDIAAGARHGDTATQAMLERELATHHADIHRLLNSYGVPTVSPAEPSRLAHTDLPQEDTRS
jgi:quinoprotein dehydrogenase-associated probable ABC transporter substrate-binding protein